VKGKKGEGGKAGRIGPAQEKGDSTFQASVKEPGDVLACWKV
jgi:hypothetical protein